MNAKPERVIDFHAHVFPDSVAPKAISKFVEVYCMQPLSDGTVAETARFMAEAGIDIFVPMPVATKASQVVDINNWAFSVRSDKVMPFGGMHPEFEDVKGELDRLVDMGFRGIKLQPDWQQFHPDDQRVYPIYERAEGRLAILFHAGQEVEEVATVYSTPDRLRRVHEKFPGLTMICAHMGGYRHWKEAEAELYGSDIYLDMSYCPEDEVSDDELMRMIRKHRTDRFLFASDFPFADPRIDLERLLRLPLTQEEVEDIAWRNAARLLGIGNR